MVNFLSLLATSYFADPEFNEGVKNGSITELPLATFFGRDIEPLLPQQFIDRGWGDSPGTWPTTSGFDDLMPPAMFVWVGEDRNPPLLPSQDPFYWPDPQTLESMQNGDIIAIRPVGLTSVFPEVREAWQISYRSESALGRPDADVTTLMVPWNYNGRSLVAYVPWEDAVNIDCAPSWINEHGLRDPTLDMFLLMGWAINTPDHQGQRSAFAAGYKSGKSTLDSIRAVTKAQELIPFSFDDVAMNGYSGGSVAIGHAVELQPAYAPELNIKGASVGGVIVELNSTLNTINNGLFAAYAFGGVYGLCKEYELMDILQNALKDDCRDRANQILDHCLAWDVVNYIGEDLYSYFKEGTNFLRVPEFEALLTREKMGHDVPKIPLFIYQAGADEIAPPEKVDQLVDFYCANGVPVDYARVENFGHLLAAVWALPDHIKFLQQVFDDDYVPMQCRNHQDAIDNNGVFVPVLDPAENLGQAILGDFRAWGLPNLMGL